MKRDQLEAELKRVGVSLNGWLPVLHCDVCNKMWEPFASAVDAPSSPTARFDYWICPNKCNASADVSLAVKTATPRYVLINDVAGMIFDDDDLREFERYAHSMDATQILNRAAAPADGQ